MNKKTSNFDLASLNTIDACNKPAEIEIKHPVTLMGTGIFIKVLGKDSDAYRGRVRAMADESLRRQALGKGGSADQTLDKLEQKNIDALVAATVGWRDGDDPALELNGEKLEFSAANARKVYSELLPVRDQVAEAINELGNFMPA
jgi:hypothetical protein